jgi:hypothetical protein
LATGVQLHKVAIIFKGGFMRINKLGGLLLSGVLAFGAPLSGFGQKAEAKEEIKDAGHAIKKVAKKTGKAVKKGTKKVTHTAAKGTRKGAEKVEEKTK